MNIGVDIRPLLSAPRTGVGEYTYELLNAMLTIDTVNQYVLFYNAAQSPNPVPLHWQKDSVRVVATRWPNKLFHASACLMQRPRLDSLIIKRTASKVQPIEVFFSPNVNFTPLSRRVKHILTIHDLSFEYFPECFSRKRRLWHSAVQPRKLCEAADVIIAPSVATVGDIMNTYGVQNEKIKVIYPGISPAYHTLVSHDSLKQLGKTFLLPNKYVLFLGTIEPRKNIIALIEAFSRSTWLEANNYQLVIAGTRGWKCDAIMKKILNTKNVQYIGYINSQDKPALYQAASLFVYPSLYEGFGFPVVEAMASGTPVITSNRSSLPEIGGQAVHLVNPYNVAEIQNAMEVILKSGELQNYYRESGRERAKIFSWEKAAKDFLGLYTQFSY